MERFEEPPVTDAINKAIDFTNSFSRSDYAVIRVYRFGPCAEIRGTHHVEDHFLGI
jgi:hypothetical protein